MKKWITLTALLMAGTLFSETTPVMLSLVTPVQAPSSEYDVTGFRLSLLYGDCHDFTGLDIGVVSRTAEDFTGLGIGGVNIAGGKLYGGQVGLINWSADKKTGWADISTGLQLGALNYAEAFCGLQDGLVNISGTSFTGLQSGLVNYTEELRGAQCGDWLIVGINVASGPVYGCQIGLINYAKFMERGVQIGLININPNNGWLPVLPILNGHF
ncbi:MAG: hypothetical protein J6336_13765 [Kiritimatiellae bacterium]|nr:hypothetical protein [Kiritimatiellia bacterium]